MKPFTDRKEHQGIVTAGAAATKPGPNMAEGTSQQDVNAGAAPGTNIDHRPA